MQQIKFKFLVGGHAGYSSLAPSAHVVDHKRGSGVSIEKLIVATNPSRHVTVREKEERETSGKAS
jgi:hypothetical protein